MKIKSFTSAESINDTYTVSKGTKVKNIYMNIIDLHTKTTQSHLNDFKEHHLTILYSSTIKQ